MATQGTRSGDQQPPQGANTAPTPTAEAARKRRSLPALRGHMTRRLNAARELIRIVEEEPRGPNIDNLKVALRRLDSTAENYAEKLIELQEIDDARFAEYESALNSLQDDATTTANRGAATIATAEAGIAPAPANDGAVQGGSAGRANEALRPFLLTIEHRPAELRSWVTRFGAYYRSGNMQNQNLVAPRATRDVL